MKTRENRIKRRTERVKAELEKKLAEVEKSESKESKLILSLHSHEEKLAKIRELYKDDFRYADDYEYISEGSDKSDYEP